MNISLAASFISLLGLFAVCVLIGIVFVGARKMEDLIVSFANDDSLEGRKQTSALRK